MVSATITGYILESFESALQVEVALTFFIPMLMNTGGNAGAQASTIVIRSLVLGEVEFKDILKIIWKEIRISTLVGITLAAFNFVRLYFLEHYELNIALTVAMTLVFTVMAAKIIGGILPVFAKKLRLDPAIMASPLITTIVDVLSLIIYFNFAIRIIGINT
jgi:magnesium transporter